MEQFEGNRYVGIHIALGMNQQENRPGIFECRGGPADQAGVKKEDVLERSTAWTPRAWPCAKPSTGCAEREGSSVTIKVRQPKGACREHTRSGVVSSTFDRQGSRKRPRGDWDMSARPSAPIAYLRITRSPRARRMTCASSRADREQGRWESCWIFGVSEERRSIPPFCWRILCCPAA